MTRTSRASAQAAMSTPPTVAAPAAARLRPRASASLILIDRSGASHRVLVGRRGSAHVFMPDLYVVPGGRRDPRDHALPFAADLHPLVLDRLKQNGRRPLSEASARALALAAARELCEETGLHLSTMPDMAPNLSCLRYIARAVTPPGASRRFDNRFFAAFTDEAGIEAQHATESAELSDLRWLSLDALEAVKMPEIVLAVLDDLKKSLESNRSLPFGSDVWVYTNRNGMFLRHRL
ncbi:NUDIX domain-containing protein [Rhizobium sp. RU35A]|uniref:NUDIX domain-containing protein n=1 Tax=Rhizobium sp. RU35A TaxID=1907414 RepID=UPI0009553F55|nr:NUDIX domain-containing protein [Rhizobium sp. RU35A]